MCLYVCVGCVMYVGIWCVCSCVICVICVVCMYGMCDVCMWGVMYVVCVYVGGGMGCGVCTECVAVWTHGHMLRPKQNGRCLPPSLSTLLS